MKTKSMCEVLGVPGTYSPIQSVADGTATPLHDAVICAPRLTVPGLAVICVPPDGGGALAGGAPPLVAVTVKGALVANAVYPLFARSRTSYVPGGTLEGTANGHEPDELA